MTITLHQYVRHIDVDAFLAAGWKLETPLGHPMMTDSLLMTRDMDEHGKRITVTTANRLPNGEIEILAIIDGKEQILVAARNVAAALSNNITRELSET